MIYLIDFENVHEEGFSSLGRLGEKDAVYCFFTKNVAKISMSALAGIRSGQLHFVEAETGKQSLDLVLVSYLGYLIGTMPDEKAYEIVSNDNGFLKSADFWNTQGMDLHVRVRKTETTGKRVRVEAKAAPLEESAAGPTAPAQPAQAGQSRQRRRGGQRGKLRQNASVDEQKKTETTRIPDIAKKTPMPEPVSKVMEAGSQQGTEKPESKAVAAPASPEKETLAERTAKTEKQSASKPVEKAEASAPVTKTPAEPAPEVKEQPAEKPAETAKAKEATAEKLTDIASETAEVSAKAPEQKSSRMFSDEKAIQKNALIEALTKAGIDIDPAMFLAAQVEKFAEEKNFKQLIYRALVKQYGQKAGTAIYNIAKKVQV